MTWGFDDTWFITDQFLQEWRFWIVPLEQRHDVGRISRWDLAEDPLFHLIYFSFDESRATCDDRASALIAIYDALTGSDLGARLPRPTKDPRGLLRNLEPGLSQALYGAVEMGVLKFEKCELPWPFPEKDERPDDGKEAPREQEDWIRVLLFDSAGQPIPSDLHGGSVTANIVLSGGKEYPKNAISAGRADVASFPPGTPSACTVSFLGLHDVPSPVPKEAPPEKLVRADGIDKQQVRAPLEGPRLLGRRELKEKQRASLGSTNAFQLKRRHAEAIELEHFTKDGALLWPGEAPEDVVFREGAPRVRGMDALREALGLATGLPLESMRVTVHGSTLPSERGKCVLALLVGDDAARVTWVDLAVSKGSVKDQQAILRWLANEFGWPCDPGKIDGERGERTQRAVTAFQRAYNADVEAGAFPGRREKLETNGTVDGKTWGGMFDGYQRALHASKSGAGGALEYIVVDGTHDPHPKKLAKIAAPGSDETKWPDLNRLNPSMVRPAGRGWYAAEVGQRIYIPRDWDISALVNEGYVTHDTEMGAKPAAAIPAPGPVLVHCGNHHVKTPFAKKRRGQERRVEILFFQHGEEPELVCTADSEEPCTTKSCELYDPREFSLTYPPEGFSIYFDAAVSKNELRYVLSTSDGSYRQERSGSEATVAGAKRHRLTFTEMKPGASYSLDKLLSDKVAIRIFENVPHDDLFAVAESPAPPPAPVREFRAALDRLPKKKKKPA